MGLFRKPTKQDFPDLPDNLYFARVARISKKVGVQSQKEYLSWGFEIVQPPFQKRWVWGNTQPSVTPKTQTGKFLTALGVNIENIDETFNEQSLVGMYIKVLVETKENETSGDKFQNVTKLMTILDSEQPILQQWLAQLEVKGAVTAPISFCHGTDKSLANWCSLMDLQDGGLLIVPTYINNLNPQHPSTVQSTH